MLTEQDIRDLKCEYAVNIGSGGAFQAHDIWIPIFEIQRKLALDIDKEKVASWKNTEWFPMRYGFTDYLPFIDKGIDLIIATDFIEHLSQRRGHYFLQEIDRVCKKVSILFTPYGFFDTKVYQAEYIKSAWDWHQSGWYPEDFQDYGYETEVLENFHNYGGKSFDAIWAWRVF